MDTGLNTELKQRALALYRAPFRVEEGVIYDAAGQMVADDRDGVMRVRGWGRIGYLKDGAALQDMVGELLVEALNAYWSRAADTERQDSPAAPGTPAVERAARHYGVPAALLQSLADQEAGMAPAAPGAQSLPHPDCDEACHYHCTEAGSRAPSCIAEAAAQYKAAASAQQVAQNAEGLPPPDYYVSSQHGKLLAAYGGEEPNDPAYRWQPVWGAPVYEQNAVVRAKAAQLDELAPLLECSGYASVPQAAMAALAAEKLSDELISGVTARFGLAGIAPAQRVKAVREVLRCAGIKGAHA